MVRRGRGIAWARRREEHARHRGPGAAGPPQHDLPARTRTTITCATSPRARISRPSICDLRQVAPGDTHCRKCGEPLEIHKTVEIGHIFKLGYKYSESMGLQVLNETGEEVTPSWARTASASSASCSARSSCITTRTACRCPPSIAPFRSGGNAGQHCRCGAAEGGRDDLPGRA